MTLTADEPEGSHVICPNCGSRITPYTVNNVTVQVAAGAGAALELSQQQIKRLVEEVQRKLLEQAHRNRKRDDGTPGT